MSNFFGYTDENHARTVLGDSFIDILLKEKPMIKRVRACIRGQWPCLGGGWNKDHPFDYGEHKIVDGTLTRIVHYTDMGQLISVVTISYKGDIFQWSGETTIL